MRFSGHLMTVYLSGTLRISKDENKEIYTMEGNWSQNEKQLQAGSATETFVLERTLIVFGNKNGAKVDGEFTGRYTLGGKTFGDECELTFTQDQGGDECLYHIDGDGKTSLNNCYVVTGTVHLNTDAVYMTRLYYDPDDTSPARIRNEISTTAKRRRVTIGRVITSATTAFRRSLGKDATELQDEYEIKIGESVYNETPEIGMLVCVKFPNGHYYYGDITKILSEEDKVFINFDDGDYGWYSLPEDLNDDDASMYLLASNTMMDKFAGVGTLLLGMRVMHITTSCKGTICSLKPEQIEGVISVGILYDGEDKISPTTVYPSKSSIFFIGSRTRERDREWENDVPDEGEAPAKFNMKEDSDVDMNLEMEEKSASTVGAGKENEEEAKEELEDLMRDKVRIEEEDNSKGKVADDTEADKDDAIEVGTKGGGEAAKEVDAKGSSEVASGKEEEDSGAKGGGNKKGGKGRKPIPKAQKKDGYADEKQALVDLNCPKSLQSEGENLIEVTGLVKTLVTKLIKDHASNMRVAVSDKNKKMLFDDTERCFHNGELGNAKLLNFYNQTVQEAKEKIDTLVLTAANDSRKELYDTVGVSMSGELVLKNDEKDETIRKLMEENARLRLQNSSVTEDEVVKERMDRLVSEWKSKMSEGKETPSEETEEAQGDSDV